MSKQEKKATNCKEINAILVQDRERETGGGISEKTEWAGLNPGSKENYGKHLGDAPRGQRWSHKM